MVSVECAGFDQILEETFTFPLTASFVGIAALKSQTISFLRQLRYFIEMSKFLEFLWYIFIWLFDVAPLLFGLFG